MSKFYTNNQNQYNYILLGDRRSPVILFLHGFMGSGEDFRDVADLLKEDFCCLLIDLPGHGKTEVKCDRDYTMPEVAIAIITLLERLTIKQCFLVGYSMGGRLALYLAVYFPHYFKKVILESASPGLKTQCERENRIKQDLKVANQLKSLEFSLFLEQWYKSALFTSFRHHPNYQKAIAKKLQNNPDKLIKSLHYMGLGVQPSLWNYLKSISLPTLLIVGELDPKFIAINQRISLLSPRFRLEIVKNIDHNVHFGHYIKFALFLRDFIKNLV